MRHTYLLDLGDSDEAELVLHNLHAYARLQGTNLKRLLILGAASYIERSGDNPELIKQLADYVTMPRKNGKR